MNNVDPFPYRPYHTLPHTIMSVPRKLSADAVHDEEEWPAATPPPPPGRPWASASVSPRNDMPPLEIDDSYALQMLGKRASAPDPPQERVVRPFRLNAVATGLLTQPPEMTRTIASFLPAADLARFASVSREAQRVARGALATRPEEASDARATSFGEYLKAIVNGRNDSPTAQFWSRVQVPLPDIKFVHVACWERPFPDTWKRFRMQVERILKALDTVAARCPNLDTLQLTLWQPVDHDQPMFPNVRYGFEEFNKIAEHIFNVQMNTAVRTIIIRSNAIRNDVYMGINHVINHVLYRLNYNLPSGSSPPRRVSEACVHREIRTTASGTEPVFEPEDRAPHARRTV